MHVCVTHLGWKWWQKIDNQSPRARSFSVQNVLRWMDKFDIWKCSHTVCMCGTHSAWKWWQKIDNQSPRGEFFLFNDLCVGDKWPCLPTSECYYWHFDQSQPSCTEYWVHGKVFCRDNWTSYLCCNQERQNEPDLAKDSSFLREVRKQTDWRSNTKYTGTLKITIYNYNIILLLLLLSFLIVKRLKMIIVAITMTHLWLVNDWLLAVADTLIGRWAGGGQGR